MTVTNIIWITNLIFGEDYIILWYIIIKTMFSLMTWQLIQFNLIMLIIGIGIIPEIQ